MLITAVSSFSDRLRVSLVFYRTAFPAGKKQHRAECAPRRCCAEFGTPALEKHPSLTGARSKAEGSEHVTARNGSRRAQKAGGGLNAPFDVSAGRRGAVMLLSSSRGF
ncbi:hypothetical protein AOLI_G00131330 [Acnodon oligacanthus]